METASSHALSALRAGARLATALLAMTTFLTIHRGDS